MRALLLSMAVGGALFADSSVRDFGATGRKADLATKSIQAAIEACAAKGGGTVLIPAGTYLVDPVADHNAGLRLGSDMTLRLEPGAADVHNNLGGLLAESGRLGEARRQFLPQVAEANIP